MAKYFGDWDSHEAVASDYKDNTPSDSEIVYAGYTYEDYSGSAIVVFVRDGKLFENNDSHCSCYGLEDWSPEETTADALFIRKGWDGLSEALETAGFKPPVAQ